MTIDQADLLNRFTYHPPKDGQASTYEQLRAATHDLAVLFTEKCPASREHSLAITHLEDAVMWANAAIARHG